jgi:arylformamidase
MAGKKKKHSALDGDAWLDVSIALRNGMVNWPDDPPFLREELFHVSRGDKETLSAIAMTVHAGTHLDAPSHYLKGEAGIEEIPFDTLIGTARVIEIKDRKYVTANELDKYGIGCGERILLKTRNSARCYKTDAFIEDYVSITPGAAQFLVSANPRMVGIDYLSVGGYLQDNVETHQTLLKAGIWILEGLNLARIAAGTYDFICLPLNIPGSEGAPARAVLRPQ